MQERDEKVLKKKVDPEWSEPRLVSIDMTIGEWTSLICCCDEILRVLVAAASYFGKDSVPGKLFVGWKELDYIQSIIIAGNKEIEYLNELQKKRGQLPVFPLLQV